jgi:CRP-like cAMP-binding protein
MKCSCDWSLPVANIRSVSGKPDGKPVSKSTRRDALGNVINNGILLALPRKECDALLSEVEFVRLPVPFLLNEIAKEIEFGYFINSGLASILSVMKDGKSVEVGLVGKEGFVGTPLIAGFRTSPTRVLMQISGDAFRIRSKDLKIALRQHPSLDKLLQRSSQELAMQAAQVAACNRLHGVESRLARWLLMSQDRIGGQTVPLTQEFLSHMLGTRRASVTVGAAALQKAGLISYKRGELNVTNRHGLEQAACECYGILVRQAHAWNAEAD